MTDLATNILSLINSRPGSVWVPADFLHLGSRDLVDKTLQRLVAGMELRRIDRGLYDKPRLNRLTGRPAVPDYRAVVDAIARRDKVRILVDGMTAANDLGFTNAVPARVVLHTELQRKTIKLDNLVIEFKKTAASKLYWAGRPAMKVVQALHWLKDTLKEEGSEVRGRLLTILADPEHGAAMKKDLVEGFNHLPGWMQDFLLSLRGGFDHEARSKALLSTRGIAADRARRRPRQSADAGVKE